MSKIYRQEYPRPQFERDSFINLNGEWEFYNDLSCSGKDRKVYEEKFQDRINVPFCPESKLSGIGDKDFMPSVWYAKTVDFTMEQLKGRIILHFGAVDYKSTVYLNGEVVGTHIGGYTSFSVDLTEKAKVGENRIVVHAEDDNRTGLQPRGKQSSLYYSHGCDYTRTTGIWQTVWIELVDEKYLKSVKIDATNLSGEIIFDAKLNESVKSGSLLVNVTLNGEKVGEKKVEFSGSSVKFSLQVSKVQLWEVLKGGLYDVEYIFTGDGSTDKVKSYFGIRRIDIDGRKILINGKPVFQRLVLDQGFYPDGIYTAPTDEALERDIDMSIEAGFNGARMHQKVFEERFTYYADKKGYILWGEFADWGLNPTIPEHLGIMLTEWIERVERDINHPSIICWCPLNETWDFNGSKPIADNVRKLYLAAKALDGTRPVVDTSGGYHTITDIYDIHDYEQSVEIFKERYAKCKEGEFYDNFAKREHYDGKSPYFISEYGGVKWDLTEEKESQTTSWGYGKTPESEEETIDRICGLTKVLLGIEEISGFCYTQLTDVEQERNGLYAYDRSLKFSKKSYEKLYKAFSSKAEIEK